ncbi:glycosyltransferase [Bdellovibrio sp. HCB185ZH]|uniref:glycosyltransferase n=1 Tax=Bdellovibrio sp. HCB185ZH TaxID=3394235 RepID=UPI0039A641CB
MKNGLVVFDMTNVDSGFAKYASAMVENLANIEIYVRARNRKVLPHNVVCETHLVDSYTGTSDIVVKSLTVLPLLLFFLLRMRLSGKISHAYFPYFNHWNVILMPFLRFMGVMVIYTSHDGLMHFGEKKEYTQFLMNMNIRLANKVIFLSDATRRQVLHVVGAKPYSIIPHGLFRLEGMEDLEFVREKPNILFIGRVSKYKGVELLLEAVSKIHHSKFEKLVVAGKSNYKIQAISGGNVTIDDNWLSEDDITRYINDSDIMVFPYLESTQSGALTLGISAARPLLATRVGGIEEQVTEDEAFLVDPTVDGLHKGLLAMIDDVQLRSRQIVKLKEKRDAHSWCNLSKRVENFIFGLT